MYFKSFQFLLFLAAIAFFIGADSLNRTANGSILMFAIGKESATLNNQTGDEEGVTDLMRAARDGERKQVKQLLKGAADVNAKDPHGWTALTYAAAKGDKEIVKALLDKGADPNAEADYTPLDAAVTYHNDSVVKLLIERGTDINRKDKAGNTPLDHAISTRNNKIVKMLREAGAIERQGSRADAQAVSQDNTSLTNTPKPVSSRPILLSTVRPVYTEEALKKGIHGIVRMRILVSSDGVVRKTRVLTGLPYGLTYMAINAARQMRFEPAKRDGLAVSFWVPIEVEFNIK